MKTYKTNQASIDKGILERLKIFCYWQYKNIILGIINDEENIEFKIIIDNRIKGYCLKEVK